MSFEEPFLGNAIDMFATSLTYRLNEAVSKVSGLSPSACAAIVNVGNEPDKPIDHLRKSISLQHSSAVRLIKRLEAQGLLERDRGYGGDMRHVTLALTSKGETCLEKIVAVRCKILRELVEALDEKDQACLRRHISVLTGVLEGEDFPGSGS